MTCLLNIYGSIPNINEILDYLKEEERSFYLIDGSASNENNENRPNKRNDKKENWLEKFHVSLSPYGNLLVIANDENIVICQGKWSMNNQVTFPISFKLDFKEEEQKEIITAVCVIPIASQKKSGEGLLEWTCIFVGFNSGRLRMYTENGTLLTTQIFHANTIKKIKCRTYEPAKYLGWIQQPEEIEILYGDNVLVCIDGCNMFHFLGALRKYAASSETFSLREEMIPSLSLDFKIWDLGYQTKNQHAIDFVSAGLTSENRFDQLFSASLIGGPNEKFESIPPCSNRYLISGNQPFINFYYTIEGLSVPVFTEVKQAAGKVTSALMNAAKGWMGFGKTQQEPSKIKPKFETPTFLPARFGIHDQRRKGETIIIAPANNLAAITDSFGRVILVDVLKGIAIRIFKGYRDAQIGWICVDDETEDKNNKRYAIYLIIYAPKRGLLEIWGCQQGIRVAAFNVGKTSKLFFAGYYMLTLNGGLSNEQFKNNHRIQCFLVNLEGIIKNIQIPFHLILSDKSNQRVRDTILLKKLKSILRGKISDDDQFWENLKTMLTEFKTASIKQQAIEKIINTDGLSIPKLLQILHEQLNIIRKNGVEQSREFLELGFFCKTNYKLIFSYSFIDDLKLNDAKLDKDIDKIEELSEKLELEYDQLNDYFNLKHRLEKAIFTGSSSTEMTLAKYLSYFELSNRLNTSNLLEKFSVESIIEQLNSDEYLFHLHKNITYENKKLLGEFYFSKLFNKQIDYNHAKINEAISFIPLKKVDILDLIVLAWTDNNYENFSCLYPLISELNAIQEDDMEKVEFSEEQRFCINDYMGRFKIICENTSISYLSSLLLIVWIFRSILNISSRNETNDIETLSSLSDRLITLTKFNLLLTIGNKKIDTDSINLRSILSKGNGVLSEILAKHVVLNEFPPLLLTLIDTSDQIDDEKENPMHLLENQEFSDFYYNLQEARKYLPHSLEPDILLSNCVWEAVNLFDKTTELDVHYLEISQRYSSEIGNSILKQGVLSLSWHHILIKKISALTNLIEKVGKTPKDRLLRKEVGLNENNLINFLECVMTTLDLIMDANCSINEVPIFMNDKFWKNDEEAGILTTLSLLSPSSMSYNDDSNTETYSLPVAAKPKQFVELAADQKHVNYFLCLFQMQLIRILYLIIKYNMKHTRPYSFFDTKGKHILFSELHTHPLISNDVDIKIMNARKLFFTKAINSVLENATYPKNTKSKLPKEYDKNLETIFSLSKDMGVDSEFIKGYYCCMLYAIDYHNEAEMILRTIKDTEVVASQLLVVVGWKINEILKAKIDVNLVSILSTNLSTWLKSIGNPDYKIYTLPSKQPILELIDNLISRLADSSTEYKIAVELFDFIENTAFQFTSQSS